MERSHSRGRTEKSPPLSALSVTCANVSTESLRRQSQVGKSTGATRSIPVSRCRGPWGGSPGAAGVMLPVPIPLSLPPAQGLGIPPTPPDLNSTPGSECTAPRPGPLSRSGEVATAQCRTRCPARRDFGQPSGLTVRGPHGSRAPGEPERLSGHCSPGRPLALRLRFCDVTLSLHPEHRRRHPLWMWNRSLREIGGYPAALRPV